MKHKVSGKKLGRTAAHRKSLLRNLSDALILNGSVTTTLAKAKYVRPYVESLITDARKNGALATRRRARTKLFTDDAAKKLFDEVAPMYVGRNGGYTRIVRVGNRDGDNAMMARIELVRKEVKEQKKDTQVKQAKTKPASKVKRASKAENAKAEQKEEVEVKNEQE